MSRPDPEIVLTQTRYSVPPQGGEISVSYRIDNPIDGKTLKAAVDDGTDWLHGFALEESDRLTFEADATRDETERSAVVTLSYEGAEPVAVTVMQGAFIPEFEITVEEYASSWASLSCSPTDKQATYVFRVVEAEEIDKFATAEEFIAEELHMYDVAARLNDMDLETFLREMLLTSGDRSQVRANNLTPGTDYYAYAFGLTTDGVSTTGLYKEPFRTPAVEMSDCELLFAFDGVTQQEIGVSVTPSDKTLPYYFDMTTKEEFDELGPEAFLKERLAYLEEQLRQLHAYGYDDLDWSHFTRTGDLEKHYTGFEPGTAYVFYAFGLEAGVATTPLAYAEQATLPGEALPPFELKVSSTAPTYINVMVTPSPKNKETTFYVGCALKADVDSGGIEAAVGEELDKISREIEQAQLYGIDKSWKDYVWQGKHAHQLTKLKSKTEYTVYVFGLDLEGNRTTQIITAEATTTGI